MTESRDPKTCPSCGTVNPWLNENCRSCGADLDPAGSDAAVFENSAKASDGDISRAEVSSRYSDNDKRETLKEQEETDGTRVSTTSIKKRWNVLWIIIGILLYLAVVGLGEIVILKLIVAPDPELRPAVEEVASQRDPKSLSEVKRQELKALLFSKPKFIAATLMLLLVTPVLIGGVIGFFSKGILEGAAAMGLAAVLVMFQAGQAAYALAAGPIYAALGWAGAVGGYKILRRIRSGK